MPFVAPSAHIGVTSLYGIALPSGSEAQSASRNQSVEIEHKIGAAGEIVKLLPHKTKKTEVTVGYIGSANLTGVTLAQGLDPSTLKITKAESTEEPNKNLMCSLTASKQDAFADDGSGSGAGSGAQEPTADDLILRTITFSCADQVKRSTEVKDIVIIGGDGTPKWRGTCTKKNSFGVRFKGDLPTGVVLGTAGAAVYGFTGGVFACEKLMEEQTKDAENSGSYDGIHAPSSS